MATVTATHAPTLSSDAIFRGWAQFIHDALTTTSGWVDTAATGEVNLATMTAPGANNTYAGFKVYRMADSLQATYPCYLKVEYGRGNGVNYPSVRLSVGAVHDGSGNLTGTQAINAEVCGGNTSSASALNCFASGGTGRFMVAMFADNAGAMYSFAFGVERTKDATGADDGTGLVFYHAGHQNNTMRARLQVIPPAGGLPPTETRWMMPFSRTGASAIYDSKVGLGLLIPFAGQALRPVLGCGYLNPTDAPAYASTISSTVYGTATTYLALGTASAFNQLLEPADGGPANIGRLLMRYE